MPKFTMERLRNLALKTIVGLNATATVTSFAESYYGNYRWAEGHGIVGIMGGIWPLMIDLIILVAEAGLFVAHYDKWRLRHKSWLWFVMLTALGVSVGANTGHIISADWLTHLTASLAPVALMFTTTVGFGVMKRTFMHKPLAESPAGHALTETLPPLPGPHAETSQPWVEKALTETSQPVVLRRAETVSPPLTETPVIEAERPAPNVPEATETSLTETLVSLGFKATEKSYTMPRDPRAELTLPEKRTRDMYDVDPDITANAVSKALGIAWATADKYLKATKEARGIA
jgi:hypothetical protein